MQLQLHAYDGEQLDMRDNGAIELRAVEIGRAFDHMLYIGGCLYNVREGANNGAYKLGDSLHRKESNFVPGVSTGAKNHPRRRLQP